MDDIRVRDVPEQTVLTEKRHIRVEELPGWILEASARQNQALSTVGGPVGPYFVVYYGEVTATKDGPVELCSPISPDNARVVALPSRVEPAHREAFVRITKQEVRFPQILRAYEAVEKWALDGSEQFAGNPREVYFVDFDAAGPRDEVVDIALPIVVR